MFFRHAVDSKMITSNSMQTTIPSTMVALTIVFLFATVSFKIGSDIDARAKSQVIDLHAVHLKLHEEL